MAAAAVVVWDCDGVVFDSNDTKLRAFREVLDRHEQPDVARERLEYIAAHPHATRHQLFGKWHPPNVAEARIAEFTETCERMYQNLLPIPDAVCIARRYASAVISNSCQQQLRRIFNHHAIRKAFRLGVYGSPHTKDEHFAALGFDVANRRPAAFVGDGRLDWEVACRHGVPFVFMAKHSAWADGAAVCAACPNSTVCTEWPEVDAALARLTSLSS